ncbi:MAG: tetratricopeptide repeat protein [Alphaproteobacteria bacterium]
MSRNHKIFPYLAAALLFAATPALAAHSGPELAAIFDKGVAAYDAGDYENAFKIWWDIRFEDLAAMRNLGLMLRKGQGTPRDPHKAEEVYMRAAVAGLPTAQADLADMYLKGELGPPDMRKIVPLLEAAAAANHPVAQYQLGQFYETGAPPFVPQDLETAPPALRLRRQPRHEGCCRTVGLPWDCRPPRLLRVQCRARPAASSGARRARYSAANARARSCSLNGLPSLGALTSMPPGSSA